MEQGGFKLFLIGYSGIDFAPQAVVFVFLLYFDLSSGSSFLKQDQLCVLKFNMVACFGVRSFEWIQKTARKTQRGTCLTWRSAPPLQRTGNWPATSVAATCASLAASLCSGLCVADLTSLWRLPVQRF